MDTTTNLDRDTIIIKKISGILDQLYHKYNLGDFVSSFLSKAPSLIDSNMLGKGTFSKVYRTLDNETQKYCAIKMLKVKYQNFSKQEIYYLRKIGRHENIIPLLDYFNFNDQICIIYPLYSCNLYQFLKKKIRFIQKEIYF